MKIFLGLFFSLCIISSFQVSSLEVGKWNFVKTDEYCYIGSMAIETDLSPEKNRGEYYILVYKIIGSEENIIQIEAGYQYNLDKKINVKIDNANYDFYSTEESSETAWTNDDNKVIFAMKKGLELTLTGESKRGTLTNDVYTLKGFTNAVNQLNKDC